MKIPIDMPHYLSIVACMKNEARNIEEWIEFHKKVGADHFYLYDNESTDNTEEILKPYVDAGDVSLFHTDMDTCQFACYYNALTAFRDQSRWMAFIDLDEFFFSPKGDLIKELKVFEEFTAGIAVNEVFFGSNSHLTRPEGGVLKNYTKREKEINKHIKTVCQPIHTFCPSNNPHSFTYIKGFAVNEKREPCPGPFNEPATADIFRINHYWVKSKEEYEIKMNRGRADVPRRDPKFRYSQQGRNIEEVFKKDNEIEDTLILDYVKGKNTLRLV